MKVVHDMPDGDGRGITAALDAFWGEGLRLHMTMRKQERETMGTQAKKKERPTIADDLVGLRGAMGAGRGQVLDERIREMLTQGLSATDVAWRTGVSLSSVYDRMARLRRSGKGVTS